MQTRLRQQVNVVKVLIQIQLGVVATGGIQAMFQAGSDCHNYHASQGAFESPSSCKRHTKVASRQVASDDEASLLLLIYPRLISLNIIVETGISAMDGNVSAVAQGCVSARPVGAMMFKLPPRATRRADRPQKEFLVTFCSFKK